MEKVSWDIVYNHFKAVYPKLGKMSVHFRPSGYMTIVVYLSDRTQMVYDDLKKHAIMIAA